ncbi:MAG TPA: ATP-binding protein [Nocardioides sp.]|jgi:hypothetical protein
MKMMRKTAANAVEDDAKPARPDRAPLWSRLGSRLGGPRSAHLQLSARTIVGHLVATDRDLWAWYALGPQMWSFRTPNDRELLWEQVRNRLAGLGGHAVKLRVSSKPFPTYEFARKLAADTPDPLPPSPGGDFDQFLERQQRRLLTAPVDESVTMLGVRLTQPPKASTLRALYTADATAGEPGPELARMLEELRQINELVDGAGLDAKPLTPQQMSWLMHRSVAPGMPVAIDPAPAGAIWEHDDLYAFTDPVEWIYTPMGPTVRVEAKIRGRIVTRHVAVLSVGRMPDRQFPEDGLAPWMLATARLGYPVEWSVSGVLLGAAALTPRVDYDRQRALGIKKHYQEHEEMPPPAVDRAITQAVLTYDEVTEGEPREAVRFEGPIRAAVYADTERECLERVRNLIDVYGDHHRIELAHPAGQRDHLREFIPGEAWSKTGFQRKMSVGYLAAAMPHVSSNLGTPAGPYIGYTVGTARRAVRFDGHYGMEWLNTPGVFPLVADPGGGKSFGSGTLAAMGAERGEPTILLDPSGPLSRLCELERFKPYARALNLTESEPGTLAPWQLIPEPEPHQYDSDRKFERAVRLAKAERMQLGYDTFRMLMPEGLLRDAAIDETLHEAVRAMGGEVTVNSRQVWSVLRSMGSDPADRIAKRLEEAAGMPLGELIFPATDDMDLSGQAEDKRLVVITMPGLVVPNPDTPREHWGLEEMYTQPLLHLAAFYTSRFIYRRPMKERKNIILDENHFMGNWGSGRALMMRLSRDSRKWDTAVYPASQHPDDILNVGRVESLIGGAFVGRIEDLETAQAAMRLVRAPIDYAPVVQKLSPRPAPGEAIDVARTGEFVFLDPYGRVDKFRFDATWWPELEKVLDTTPGHRRLGTGTAGPSPFIDDARNLFRVDENRGVVA